MVKVINHLTKTEGSMKNVTLLGVDIAKNVFQLHGIDEQGNPVLRKRLSRSNFIREVANMKPCTIAMEACGGANYWSRKFKSFGHEVKLINPQFVKPFVKSNKNDRNDSEAICEAALRPTMRFVSPKTVEQEDLQAIHRIRSRMVQEKTALVNQIRGLLMEYGIIVSQGIYKLKKSLPEILEDAENELSPTGRQFFYELYSELIEKDKKVAEYEHKIEQIFKSNEACQKISKIEGIGPIGSTAIVAAIGDPKSFKNGRQFAAFLGLVPRQKSSGNKQRLLGISKRGDKYIRSILIHGARIVVRYAKNKEDNRSEWINKIKEKRGANKAAVALANKNARIIWSILAKGGNYEKAA